MPDLVAFLRSGTSSDGMCSHDGSSGGSSGGTSSSGTGSSGAKVLAFSAQMLCDVLLDGDEAVKAEVIALGGLAALRQCLQHSDAIVQGTAAGECRRCIDTQGMPKSMQTHAHCSARQ